MLVIINGLLIPKNQRAVQRICPKTKETKTYESITKAFEDNKDIAVNFKSSCL